ncbi:MAG: rhomboid family intramembrane serine protease [Bacteroidia bacterium]|nr:rhomboid family intramembrane serine protease [Bacteroidia bacterium]
MSYQQYRPQRFQVLPVVVKNLLIINGLMFLATLVFRSQFQLDLTQQLGLHYWSSDLFKPYQFITYMFMHGGFDHVLFNMFALWMFGNVLENYWGPKRFLIYYMVTGIGAALIYMGYEAIQFYQINESVQAFMMNPIPEEYYALIQKHFGIYLEIPENQIQIDNFVSAWQGNSADAQLYVEQGLRDIQQFISFQQDKPVVGASGSVFGVLLAFGMLFPNTLLYIYFLFPLKAKYFVILYGALELYLGVLNNPGDNVAHFAHLGGMLFGFFMIKYWQRKSNHFY